MTVNELIQKLQKLPGDLDVHVRAHDWEEYDRTGCEGTAEYVLVEEEWHSTNVNIIVITDEI